MIFFVDTVMLEKFGIGGWAVILLLVNAMLFGIGKLITYIKEKRKNRKEVKHNAKN